MNCTSNDSMKQLNTRFSFRFSSFICLLLILPVYCLTLYADDSNDNSDTIPARGKFEASMKPESGALDKREWKCVREIPAPVREMQKKRQVGTHQEEVDVATFEIGYRVFDSDGFTYNVMGEDYIASDDPRGLLLRSVRLTEDAHGEGDLLVIEESAECRDIAEPDCAGVAPVVKVLNYDDLTVTSYLACRE